MKKRKENKSEIYTEIKNKLTSENNNLEDVRNMIV